MKKEGDIYQSTVPVNNIIFSLLQLNNFFQLGGYVGEVEGWLGGRDGNQRITVAGLCQLATKYGHQNA